MKLFSKLVIMFMIVMFGVMGGVYAHTIAPTLKTSLPTGSVVEPGDRLVIFIQAADEYTTIASCDYSWNGEKMKSVFDDSELKGQENNLREIEFRFEEFPNNFGKNILKISAEDEYGNSTGIQEFTYIVEDNEAPTITSNVKNNAVVKAGSSVTITMQDNYELKEIVYSWNNGEKKYPLPTDDIYYKFEYTMERFPNVNDVFELKISAEDLAGNVTTETFVYNVEYDDKTAPVISMSEKSGSVVAGGTRITMTILDEESKVTTLKYNWEGSSERDLIPSVKEPANKCVVKLPAVGMQPGTYIINVTAVNSVGGEINGRYTYIVKGEEEDTDTEIPSVVANPSSGEIEPQEVIILTAKDNEALKSLTYKWDNGNEIKKDITGTKDEVSVTAPAKAGQSLLYVVVEDENGNKATGKFVYTIATEDTEKPAVTVSPNGGVVEPGEVIEIKGKDNEGLENIIYSWDDEEPVKKPVGGKEAVINTKVPTKPGEYTLHVTVEDEDGNKVTDSIDFVVKNDEDPTITMNPKDKSEVKGGKIVKATLKDDVALKEVEYEWEHGDEDEIPLSGTSKTVSLSALPYKEGTYKVTITVTDTAGNKTTNKYTYYVVEDDDDEEYPTVDADPDGGELEYGDKIVITAEDEDGEIEYVEYYWDDDEDDTTKKYKDEFTVKVPSDEGKHYLFVRAMDDDDNLCDYEKFTYKIVENKYPGNSDIIGDINNKVRALRVEIRNADDKIRFEPDEEILYYVDYYNGTSSDVKNAKLVVDLPTYLEAEEASDDGKVATKQVTWNLGTLEAGEYGRVSFIARYTSSKVNEKIITVPAKIYSGSSLKDTSTVRNMIFCEGASGTGSHQAYCVGYPNGTFLAEGRITRAELASMIANIEGITSMHRGQFTDANNHWAANYMQAVVDRGYMIPKSYNYFGAQDYATRADLAYAIAAILDVEDLEPIFISATDTKNSDVRCAMEQLLRLGIMDGYSDGSAKPNSNITRAEAVTIFNNYLFRGELYTKGYNYAYNFENNYNHGGNYYILRFTDLSSNHWAYGHIMEATNNHRYERVMDGNEEML